MLNFSERVASDLLNIKAVFLSPKELFTWASGIKSPIYCDNRIILSYPNVRKEIESMLTLSVKINFPKCEFLIGTSTAGIPHAAIMADMLNLPMAYVRNAEKSHGRRNMIEGKIQPQTKAVVVEDLISTGVSSLNVVKTLKDSNINVLGVISIFDYNLKISKANFEKNSTVNFSLTNYDILINLAYERSIIDDNGLETLKAFREKLENSVQN
ncbi:MAG: orotate phosphoribosyltransferase [Candidatus Improbicoccus pseudotrichonymphae]|uniref:Orotate phosphoribosyltransferase n=1 Tax=Candidatus Improbicoccus pseudotrichonymphae TaxID=3033792 RepID=A0AA48HY51_9FIRM|nr:MAG: orotate phosphoribosyltransferase [Candidatus Improbicoccus pseudotrichonymphae]